MKPKILLHVCCAPCSPYVVDELRKEFDVTLFFYNPNIHPAEEYEKRLFELRSWAGAEKLPLMEEDYDTGAWFAKTEGMENEPERGLRCVECFDLRLSKTAEKAAWLKFDTYATVLTVSPHKNSETINRIGAKNAQIHDTIFYEKDWEKRNGFKISSKISKELGFYRQDYCGCVYSKPKRPDKSVTNKDRDKKGPLKSTF